VIILTCATNYDIYNVRPFMQSLEASGFKGQVYCICNGSPAEQFLRDRGVYIIQDVDNGYDINSRRFFLWKEILRGVLDQALITDIRDVIFQADPRTLPSEGVNVFTEDAAIRIGNCPYNSKWMMTTVGDNRYNEKPIICAGVTVGRLAEYCTTMWEAIRDLPRIRGLDQSVHNHLVYSGRIPATIHANPYPVYTVGYVRPHNNLAVFDGNIMAPDGSKPIVVHQYDRHPIIKEKLQWQ